MKINYLGFKTQIKVSLEIGNYLISASRIADDDVEKNNLPEYIKTYFEEANYPEDMDLEHMMDDLKYTLELDFCFVSRKNFEC